MVRGKFSISHKKKIRLLRRLIALDTYSRKVEVSATYTVDDSLKKMMRPSLEPRPFRKQDFVVRVGGMQQPIHVHCV